VKIKTLNDLQDQLDREFCWRFKEIVDMKLSLRSTEGSKKATLIRAGIPLLYAHWEGFVKSVAEAYINFVAMKRLNFAELSNSFLALAVRQHIENITTSNRMALQISAIEFLRSRSNEQSGISRETKINTRSNLNSDVFEDIAATLGIDSSKYCLRYNFINSCLIARRNAIAHGKFLDLNLKSYLMLSDNVVELLRWVKTDIENCATTQSFKQRNGA
jgi:hypothetical protein